MTLVDGFDDLVAGGKGNDNIDGGAGDDKLYGGSVPTGVDHHITYADDDVIHAGRGNDTVYGGDFLANQPPVKRMCDMAPAIINLFDRMGVPFSRTKEGLMDFRRFGGTLHHRQFPRRFGD